MSPASVRNENGQNSAAHIIARLLCFLLVDSGPSNSPGVQRCWLRASAELTNGVLFCGWLAVPRKRHESHQSNIQWSRCASPIVRTTRHLCTRSSWFHALSGSTLQTLELQPGFFRPSLESTDIRECFHEAACMGGVELSDYCAAGYTGPCKCCTASSAEALGGSRREYTVQNYNMTAPSNQEAFIPRQNHTNHALPCAAGQIYRIPSTSSTHSTHATVEVHHFFF